VWVKKPTLAVSLPLTVLRIGKNLEVSPLNDDDTELAMIRRKKMAELVAREKKLQESREQKEKVGNEREKLLKRFLDSDALVYLEHLKKTQESIGNRVQEIILYLIVYRGFRQTVKQLDIMYIERQIKGEGPKIRVQRDGETSDFGSYVRDAIKENNNESSKD
jgi:DNA-binding TFAR19-related protein (PDSD5 family)